MFKTEYAVRRWVVADSVPQAKRIAKWLCPSDYSPSRQVFVEQRDEAESRYEISMGVFVETPYRMDANAIAFYSNILVAGGYQVDDVLSENVAVRVGKARKVGFMGSNQLSYFKRKVK